MTCKPSGINLPSAVSTASVNLGSGHSTASTCTPPTKKNMEVKKFSSSILYLCGFHVSWKEDAATTPEASKAPPAQFPGYETSRGDGAVWYMFTPDRMSVYHMSAQVGKCKYIYVYINMYTHMYVYMHYVTMYI